MIGTSHLDLNLPCQDAHSCLLTKDKLSAPVLIAVASDGAGTAVNAERGATLACTAFCEVVSTFLSRHAVSDLTSEQLSNIVGEVRNAIVARALQDRASLRSYACTFLALVVASDYACFCQIGDGAMIVADESDPHDWCWVFWPQRGEFANATAFITDDDALEAIEIEVGPRRVVELAILTDGIEKLVLQYDTQSVFAPFFEAMFPPVRASQMVGEDATLSASLASYLASAAVNQRTDDDKTLILASCRAGSP